MKNHISIRTLHRVCITKHAQHQLIWVAISHLKFSLVPLCSCLAHIYRCCFCAKRVVFGLFFFCWCGCSYLVLIENFCQKKCFPFNNKIFRATALSLQQLFKWFSTENTWYTMPSNLQYLNAIIISRTYKQQQQQQQQLSKYGTWHLPFWERKKKIL